MIPEAKKTLVVTYDDLMARAIGRILCKESDIPTLEIVKSLEEARATLASRAVAVVITDWTQVNGEEVIRSAKNSGVHGIIVMNGGMVDQKTIMNLGALNLEKPFRPDELIAVVRQALRKV